MPAPVTTAQEWDKVRKAFATSIMVDTSLHSLAQNLEGEEWPINSKDDTPAKYIDLTLMEAVEMLAEKGYAPALIDQLASILRETLAFDQPFGDMVTQVAESSAKDNTLLKNLGRLGVPESYPIDFTALEQETREFCKLEKLGTLGEFAVFAQTMSQSVIVGGDFRGLLNALAQSDEKALASFIPTRAGQKGIYLPEAIALHIKRLPEAVRLCLANRAGMHLTPSQEQIVKSLSHSDFAAAESDLKLRCSRLVAEVFKEQLAQLKEQAGQGLTLARYLTPLGDPQIEAIVSGQLSPFLQSNLGIRAADSKRRPSFWARLFGRA